MRGKPPLVVKVIIRMQVPHQSRQSPRKFPFLTHPAHDWPFSFSESEQFNTRSVCSGCRNSHCIDLFPRPPRPQGTRVLRPLARARSPRARFHAPPHGHGYGIPSRTLHACTHRQHGYRNKVVSVPSVSGDDRGLPATTLVLDENTGATKAVVNARTLTSLRTAAGMFVTFIYSVADLVLLGSVLATALCTYQRLLI